MNELKEISTRLTAIESILSTLQPAQREHDFISVSEVAEMLNISVPSVYRLTMLKKIPFRKVHKRLFFSRQEILEFINSKVVK